MDSMDTLDTLETDKGQQLVSVEDQLALIKRDMPVTYAAIKAWAGRVGGQAYEMVRRGLRGEYRCFFSLEGGHRLGVDWSCPDDAELAEYHCRYGGRLLVVQLGMGEKQ